MSELQDHQEEVLANGIYFAVLDVKAFSDRKPIWSI